jgi:ABC-2 type transport system permease protein
MTGTVGSIALDRSAIAQTIAMSRRAIIAVYRQPSIVVPSLMFPLFFTALGTAAFSRAIDIPGFPQVDSFLDFALAAAIVQGILFGSTVSATALATDIENGFFDRLLAAPTSRTGILVGRLAGGMAYGGFQTLLFVALLVPFGVEVKSGLVGVALMIVGGILLALAVGALMSAVAIKTGSSEAVQGSFPLLFILLFFSSTFFPRETMRGFHRAVADLNPVSFIAEGFRSLTLEPLSATAVAQVIVLPLVVTVLTLGLSLRVLRSRLAAR